MTDLELTNKRQSIINQMMDIAASVSAADELDVMDAKHSQIKNLQTELDQLPTLSDSGKERESTKDEFVKSSMEFIKLQCEKYPQEVNISVRMQNYISRSIEGAWDAGKMEVLNRIVPR